jgi:Protein of unknown function (DUF2568)
VRYANLALAFLLELAGLAAFGYWGFVVPTGLAAKLLLGLGVPIVAAVLWGVFASPRATVPLPAPVKFGFQVTWFGAAAAALAVAGRGWLAVVFVVLGALNRTLTYVWKQ